MVLTKNLGLAKKVSRDQSKNTVDDVINSIDVMNVIKEGIIEFGKNGYYPAKNAATLFTRALNKKVYGKDTPLITLFHGHAYYPLSRGNTIPHCEYEDNGALDSATEFNKFAYASPRERTSNKFKHIRNFIEAIVSLIFTAADEYDHEVIDYIIDNGVPKRINESNLGLAKKTRAQSEDKDPVDNYNTLIDLGLPSGTLWCSCNVGSSVPEGFGDFYTHNDAIKSASSGKFDELSIPSLEDFEELKNLCKLDYYDNKIVKFVSTINGNSIVFPLSGVTTCGGEYSKPKPGVSSGYWSSTKASLGRGITLDIDPSSHSRPMYFSDSPTCLGYPLRLVYKDSHVNESNLGLAKKASDKFDKDNSIDNLNKFDTPEDACKTLEEYLDKSGYQKNDMINNLLHSSSRKKYLPLLDTVIMISTFSESNWWQVSFFEEKGTVRFSIMYSFGDPELVLGDYENPVKKWWTATPEKLMKIAKFCSASCEDTNEGLAKRVAKDHQTIQDQEDSDAGKSASTMLEDNESQEASNSWEFACMVTSEAKKRNLLAENNSGIESRQDEPYSIGTGDNDDYLFSSGLTTYDKDGDIFKTWKALDRMCVSGKVYSYSPEKKFSVLSVYTMAETFGSSNFFVIRLWFDTEENNKITNIAYGKICQKIGDLYKDHTFGDLMPLPIKRICKIAEMDPEGHLRLTRTNAILIVKLMQSFFNHKNDTIQTLEKVGEWKLVQGELKRVYHYEKVNSNFLKKIDRLTTKKSNKKICSLIMKHCWIPDFSGKTLSESRTMLGLSKKTRSSFDFDKKASEMSEFMSFDDWSKTLKLMLENIGVNKDRFAGVFHEYNVMAYSDDEVDPEDNWYAPRPDNDKIPDYKILRVFVARPQLKDTDEREENGHYIDVMPCSLGVMLYFGSYFQKAGSMPNYTYSTDKFDIPSFLINTDLYNQVVATSSSSHIFKMNLVTLKMLVDIIRDINNRVKHNINERPWERDGLIDLMTACFLKLKHDYMKDKNGE